MLKILREHKIVFVLVALFSFFELLYLLEQHAIGWDEAVYIGMGKYLFSFGANGLWEVFRPVFLPFILGFLWNIFGSANIIFLGGVLAILFSVGYILVTYFLALEIFGRRTAIWSVVLLLLMPVFFANAGLVLTDIPSSFFVLLSLFFLIKRRFVLAGVFSGLGFLMRFPHGLIIVAVGVVLLSGDFRKEFKNYLKYVSAFFTALVPFFVFNYFMYSNSSFVDAVFKPFIFALPHQANPFVGDGGITFYFLELFLDNFLIVFAVVGLFVYFKERLYVKQKVNFVLFPLVLYLLYFSLIVNEQLRFSLAFLGLLAVLGGFGLVWLFDRLKKKYSCYAVTAFVLLILIGIVISLQKDINYVEWRSSEDLSIVNEFYSFFDANEVDGKILTADPVFAAYSDELFLPYYYSVREGFDVFSENIGRGDVVAVVHVNSSFPCLKSDTECFKIRDELFGEIGKNELVFNETYGRQEYLIYFVE